MGKRLNSLDYMSYRQKETIVVEGVGQTDFYGDGSGTYRHQFGQGAIPDTVTTRTKEVREYKVRK